jgi:phosphatidylserine/phosphatidylglycerophosphate/cardiolipin synthase-like enzyme
VLRTYPARLRRYPFPPVGERSIAYACRKVFGRARRLIYIEAQYLWAPFVADLLAAALRQNPELHVVAVVPRYPDNEGISRWPSLVGREQAIRAAGGDRFVIYDLENAAGTPIYVHAKVVVVDDVWAMVGSDNLNRRSWTHDSELSCAVLDDTRDEREPRDPAGLGDGARAFARNLRLQLWREHLGLDTGSNLGDLSDPASGCAVLQQRANDLDRRYEQGKKGERPPGRLQQRRPERMPGRHRPWAVPVYRWIYDPEGRAIRDRIRRRP